LADEGIAKEISQSLVETGRWPICVPEMYMDDDDCTSIAICVEWHDSSEDMDEVFRMVAFEK